MFPSVRVTDYPTCLLKFWWNFSLLRLGGIHSMLSYLDKIRSKDNYLLNGTTILFEIHKVPKTMPILKATDWIAMCIYPQGWCTWEMSSGKLTEISSPTRDLMRSVKFWYVFCSLQTGTASSVHILQNIFYWITQVRFCIYTWSCCFSERLIYILF